MKVQSSPSSRLPIGLAFFGFALVGMVGGANGVLLPSLSAFYSVGDAVIGLLFLVSSLGYFLSALSSGLLTEQFGLRFSPGWQECWRKLLVSGHSCRIHLFLR